MPPLSRVVGGVLVWEGGPSWRSFFSVLLGIAFVVLLIVGPVAYAVHDRQHNLRNFRVVRDGVLYRSSQPSKKALQRLIHDYGIRTVISLRNAKGPGLPVPERWEEPYLRTRRSQIRASVAAALGRRRRSLAAAGEENVHQFLEVMNDPRNHPVLIHCFGGIHRTGAYCAIYRMEFEGWSNAQAINELKACGYTAFEDDWDISNYMEQYRPGQRVKITFSRSSIRLRFAKRKRRDPNVPRFRFAEHFAPAAAVVPRHRAQSQSSPATSGGWHADRFGRNTSSNRNGRYHST